jgi:hypothetical protein
MDLFQRVIYLDLTKYTLRLKCVSLTNFELRTFYLVCTRLYICMIQKYCLPTTYSIAGQQQVTL